MLGPGSGSTPRRARGRLRYEWGMASTRTPDPDSGWLSDEELAEVRRRLPILYVEAVPVRLDGVGVVTEVGALLRVNPAGSITRTLVSGRVMYGETLRDALYRHLEKDLGPMAFPQLPASPVPFSVAEYFPFPSPTRFDDEIHLTIHDPEIVLRVCIALCRGEAVQPTP